VLPIPPFFQVVNAMIHCCDQCSCPILIYGRLIPCKHVFCLTCAHAQARERGKCVRCQEAVARVEEAGLGSIYMCTHGGSRYGHAGCRRTYLSQRDLQAHVHHRHMKGVTQGQSSRPAAATVNALAVNPASLPSAEAIAEATAALVNARNREAAVAGRQPHFGRSAATGSSPYGQAFSGAGSARRPVMGAPTRSSNLIVVQQGDKAHEGGHAQPDYVQRTYHSRPSVGPAQAGAREPYYRGSGPPPPVAQAGFAYGVPPAPTFYESHFEDRWRTPGPAGAASGQQPQPLPHAGSAYYRR